MLEARKAAQVTKLIPPQENNLCGNQNKSGNNNAESEGVQPSLTKKSRIKKLRIKKPGNNCLHDPKNPSWFKLPGESHERSIVIQQAIDAARSAYFNPNKKMIQLQHHADGTQIRSEQRNVMLDLIGLMIYYMDDEIRRVGRRIKGDEWADMSISKMSKRMDVSQDRIQTAFKHIINNGYLLVSKQWRQKNNGDIYALPSIRYLTPKLFIDLGIKWERIFNLKNYREERRKKSEMKVDKKKAQVAADFIKQCGHAAKHKPKKVNTKFTPVSIPEPTPTPVPITHVENNRVGSDHIRIMQAMLKAKTG